ncbi:MAG: nuclear transport factor 2 family protein [Xanthobacteraceae bacterium]|nr:nuclear transport factor 2 family protein [Xanthobacteraceae bacterium]MBV9629658.1 nuclear transport factor 2 family protein [Xanthobacteraceae bacterium]
MGRIDDAFNRVAPDVEWQMIAPAPYGGTMDRAGAAAFLAKHFGPKLGGPLMLTVMTTTAEDNRVAVETKVYGSTKSGPPYENRVHFLIFVEGGKIVALHEYLDSATLIKFISE